MEISLIQSHGAATRYKFEQKAEKDPVPELAFAIEEAYNCAQQADTDSDTDVETEIGTGGAINKRRQKQSFVWHYFRSIAGTERLHECIICNANVYSQSSNLARHLLSSHNISNQSEEHLPVTNRARRSFIWEYCTKVDKKHARCNLCETRLYFGGGNTSNITKHLRRRHSCIFKRNIQGMDAAADNSQIDGNGSGMDTYTNESNDNSYGGETVQKRRGRKGASYVWNYCVKLSRNTVRCKLCNKVMSFHGTANIITHLQRRHNIVGKLDSDSYRTSLQDTQEVCAPEDGVAEILEDIEISAKRRRRSAASSSIVWKYCTRISTDSVVCSFCKKVLSYQGTSNLQRHLHRMHGVVTQVRIMKSASEIDFKCRQMNSNFIWEHCTQVDDDNIKCNLCNMLFDIKDTEKVCKHLTFTHGVERKKKKKWSRFDDSDGSTEEDDDYEEEWDERQEEYGAPAGGGERTEAEVHKEDSIIENDVVEHDEEEAFDDSILNEIPIANPLSPPSSRELSPDQDEKKLLGARSSNKRLQKLYDERTRVETEYFRMKADYYRMQKYLVALQAKKFRLEMERENGVLVDTGAVYECGNDVKAEGDIANAQLY